MRCLSLGGAESALRVRACGIYSQWPQGALQTILCDPRTETSRSDVDLMPTVSADEESQDDVLFSDRRAVNLGPGSVSHSI